MWKYLAVWKIVRNFVCNFTNLQYYFFMRLKALILAFCAVATMANAQGHGLLQSGISAEEVVPKGWKVLTSATEDINHDYIPDLVVIALPDNKDNIMTREDGYEINMNKPVVGVYFGSGGVYELWRSATNIIEEQSETSSLDNVSLSITAKGVVNIGYKMFYSAGSWSVPSHKFVYRYQDNDLYLIGYDSHSLHRASLEETTESYNFLTGKKQTRTTVSGKKRAPKDKWETFTKKPLVKFGEKEPIDYVADFM